MATLLYFLPYSTQWFGFDDFKKAAFFFVFGVALNSHMKSTQLRQSTVVRVLHIVMGTAISIILVRKWYGVEVLMLFAAVVMISVCWQLAVLIGENKACEWISHNNFTIYIYSWPAQAVAMVISDKMGLPWYITSLGMFLIGIAVPVLMVFMYRKLKVFHNQFFDLLLGMK